jgi:hypothetical protein
MIWDDDDCSDSDEGGAFILEAICEVILALAVATPTALIIYWFAG